MKEERYIELVKFVIEHSNSANYGTPKKMMKDAMEAVDCLKEHLEESGVTKNAYSNSCDDMMPGDTVECTYSKNCPSNVGKQFLVKDVGLGKNDAGDDVVMSISVDNGKSRASVLTLACNSFKLVNRPEPRRYDQDRTQEEENLYYGFIGDKGYGA